MYSSGNDAVDKIGMMNIEGNIIPFNWFSEFKFKNGKPDLNAIVILSEIVYWYRPKIIRDEETGMTTGIAKRFKADLLQRSYDSFSTQFGLTKRQVKECVDRLCEHGVIYREFRTVQTNTTTLFNVLFIGINADVLSSVSMYHPPTLERTTPIRLNVPPHTLERNTYTETTTETTNTDTKGYDKKADIENQFNKFWSTVPNKDGKATARKSFEKALKKKSVDELITAYKANIAYCDSVKRFYRNPSTWLNQEGWDDESIKQFMNQQQEVRLSVEQPVQQVKVQTVKKSYL